MHFTTHRLVADIPLRAGVAFRTRDYLVESLSVDVRLRRAVCRFARFPTLAMPPGPALSFFTGHPRTRVVLALAVWRSEIDFPGGPGTSWARGRTWVGHLVLPLFDLRAAQIAPRLFIVESQAAGERATTLTTRGVSVGRSPD
jgi:hypothetical protein